MFGFLFGCVVGAAGLKAYQMYQDHRFQKRWAEIFPAPDDDADEYKVGGTSSDDD